mmetsp:Transcript_77152/g.208307  ORF Transcript_77152/g.208307 Transcript_77152/m.208307 type:complete len:238 (-) Transcript_77152:1422-2135(-)
MAQGHHGSQTFLGQLHEMRPASCFSLAGQHKKTANLCSTCKPQLHPLSALWFSFDCDPCDQLQRLILHKSEQTSRPPLARERERKQKEKRYNAKRHPATVKRSSHGRCRSRRRRGRRVWSCGVERREHCRHEGLDVHVQVHAVAGPPHALADAVVPHPGHSAQGLEGAAPKDDALARNQLHGRGGLWAHPEDVGEARPVRAQRQASAPEHPHRVLKRHLPGRPVVRRVEDLPSTMLQ